MGRVGLQTSKPDGKWVYTAYVSSLSFAINFSKRSNEQLRARKIKGVLETSFIHKILPSAVSDLFYFLLKKQKIKTKTNNLSSSPPKNHARGDSSIIKN